VRTADGRELPAARAVLADVGAPQLYEQLVEPQDLPAHTKRWIRRFEYDPATVKAEWALDGPMPWRAAEMADAGTVHIAESMDHLTGAMAAIAADRIPDRPFLVAGQYAAADPTRQPPGCETFWGYTHIPRGASDETVIDRMEEEIERVAPGFRARVVGRHVASPADLEAANRNLDGGAINGGTAQLHQQLVLRPVPGLGRANTPVRGLYLASSSAHPGGGVHGACGANAARAALAARRVRR
jgi:phytoene dehydrogenase-like protein